MAVNMSMFVVAVLCAFFQSGTIVWSERTEKVMVPGFYCYEDTVQVDAAYIYSVPDLHRTSCSIKLQSNMSRLMIGFGHIKLECGQYIKLYYGSNMDIDPNKVLDCRTQKYEIKDFVFLDENNLVISFEKPAASDKYDFSLIVTSYENREFCNSTEFDCLHDGQTVCINNDLKCDAIKNCPDSRDETMCTYAGDVDQFTSLAVGIVITVVVIFIMVCICCVVAMVWCCHRCQGGAKDKKNTRNDRAQSAGTPLIDPGIGAPHPSAAPRPNPYQPNDAFRPPAYSPDFTEAAQQAPVR